VTSFPPTLARTMLALFRAAHSFRSTYSGDGAAWEKSARQAVLNECVSPDSYRSAILAGQSSTRYQVDGLFECRDGLVCCEWKAHSSSPPRSDLLGFVAATADIDSARRRDWGESVFRVFGGPIVAGSSLRRLAAHHGIVLLDLHTWPSPVLTDPAVRWTLTVGPTAEEVESLATLTAAMGAGLPLAAGSLETAMRLHDRWSDCLWEEIESDQGAFETWIMQDVAA
jgi:hypothetical protein